VKCVTLVKLVQLKVGAKKGTNLGNYINGMLGMDKQHWLIRSAIGAGAKYRDTPKF